MRGDGGGTPGDFTRPFKGEELPVPAPKPGNVPESALQNAVIDLAGTLGYMVHHCRPGMMRSGKWVTPIQGDPGFPDLVLVHRNGAVVFLELKSSTGRMTDAQTRWGERLDLLDAVTGGVCRYAVIRPRDLQRVANLLTGARERADERRQ